MLLAIGLISGVSWATIIFNILLAWIWIVSYLCAALVRTSYKWGFFCFGTVAMFLLSYSLLSIGHTTSARLGDPIKKHYLALSSYLTFFFILYPIAFGLDDGGNKITVTHGFIFWGILDLVTVPLLSLVVLALSTKWDYKVLNVYFTQYGRVAQGGEFPEKQREPVQTAPLTEPV
jgi:bacteriorhodopsin